MKKLQWPPPRCAAVYGANRLPQNMGLHLQIKFKDSQSQQPPCHGKACRSSNVQAC